MPSPVDPTAIKKLLKDLATTFLQAFHFFWSIETDALCYHIRNQYGDANQPGLHHSKELGIYGTS